MKKSAVCGILSVILAIVLLTCTVCAGTDAPITVTVDGTALSFDVPPQIISGRTLVPLRKIFEELGAFVKWDEETRTVSARRNAKTVTVTVDSAEMHIDKGDTDENGNAIIETVTLDVPAQIVSGRTLVPARAVSEAFGFDVDWAENTVVITSGGESDDRWKDHVGSIDLSTLSFDTDGIGIEETRILITRGGDYTVTGTLRDGGITVATDEKVKLRLAGASITSENEPAIYFEKANKAYITLTEGTENTLISGSDKGVIYSKENLEIKGGGALTVEAVTAHGIKASDNLTIENGSVTVNAAEDGIHVNDTFRMTGGELAITSVGDGIESESIVAISDGTVRINTVGTPVAQTEMASEGRRGMFGGRNEKSAVEFASSTKGICAEWMLCISGGDITVDAADHAIHCADEIDITGGTFRISSAYGKGISGHGNVRIDGEHTAIDITGSTEGIESKNVLTVNDGTIHITASDDGINATGGSSGEMMGFPAQNRDKMQMPQEFGDLQRMSAPEREGMPPEEENAPRQPRQKGGTLGEMPDMPRKGMNGGANRKSCLIINGGDLTVNAGDDCFDSNGSMTVTGGRIRAVKTNGTLTGNNSIFDAEGQITVGSGVTVIAAGSGGTLDVPQNSITVYGETGYKSGDEIRLSDKSGKVIAEYRPDGDFRAVFVTSPELVAGESYTVTVGNSVYTVTVSGQSTVVGTPDNAGGNRSWRPMGM